MSNCCLPAISYNHYSFGCSSIAPAIDQWRDLLRFVRYEPVPISPAYQKLAQILRSSHAHGGHGKVWHLRHRNLSVIIPLSRQSGA